MNSLVFTAQKAVALQPSLDPNYPIIVRNNKIQLQKTRILENKRPSQTPNCVQVQETSNGVASTMCASTPNGNIDPMKVGQTPPVYPTCWKQSKLPRIQQRLIKSNFESSVVWSLEIGCLSSKKSNRLCVCLFYHSKSETFMAEIRQRNRNSIDISIVDSW